MAEASSKSALVAVIVARVRTLEPMARAAALAAAFTDLDLTERFTVLHQLGVYQHRESLSGEGSTLAETRALREALPALCSRLGVRSVLDAPCGDFHWMSRLELPVVSVIGIDVVEELVERNHSLHSAPGRSFARLDATSDPLPKVDLVICRDLMVHLSGQDILRLLDNFVASGSTWLLASHFVARTENPDILSGDFRPVNLSRPPFCLPDPREVIAESTVMGNGIYADRAMALWHIDDLAKRRA